MFFVGSMMTYFFLVLFYYIFCLKHSFCFQGFSLVLVQHKEKDFLVAFGGSKKEPTNQVRLKTCLLELILLNC